MESRRMNRLERAAAGFNRLGCVYVVANGSVRELTLAEYAALDDVTADDVHVFVEAETAEAFAAAQRRRS